jgi:Putative auto-transporter adhesin, head GIN domain
MSTWTIIFGLLGNDPLWIVSRLERSLINDVRIILKKEIPDKRGNMNNKIGILFTLILVSLSVACDGQIGALEIVKGSGNVVTENRDVSEFTAVSLQGVGELFVDQTGTESLAITADDNLLPYIKTRVSGDKLIISVEKNTTFSNVSELTYHVTVVNLDELELDGFGQLTADNLNGETLSVQLDGAGSITVSGEVDRQTVEINGAGGYDAADLKSQEATVTHNGAGLAVVQVSDQLDATINGIGTVEYIGDPQVTKDVSGLGSVRQQ